MVSHTSFAILHITAGPGDMVLDGSVIIHVVSHVTYHRCPWRVDLRNYGDLPYLLHHVIYHHCACRLDFRGSGGIPHFVQHVTYHHRICRIDFRASK